MKINENINSFSIDDLFSFLEIEKSAPEEDDFLDKVILESTDEELEELIDFVTKKEIKNEWRT